MFYLIYKITNILNGKIYIGKHQTPVIDDGYMGSGKLIKRAIKKYGEENFIREIIYFSESYEDMNNKELSLVNEEFISRNDTYNIRVGGDGGWEHINKNKEFYDFKRKETRESRTPEEIEIDRKKKSIRASGENNPMFGSKRFGNLNPMYGKSQSDYCRNRCREVNLGKVALKNKETGEFIGVFDKNDPIMNDPLYVGINYGKRRTDEYKLEKSRHNKKIGLIPPSPKGMLWWNDGINCKRSKTCPGEKWVRGRIMKCRDDHL